MVKNNPCWRCYIQRRLLCPEWLTMCTSTTSTSICTERWLAQSYYSSDLVWCCPTILDACMQDRNMANTAVYQCCFIQFKADHWDQLTRHCSRSLPSSIRSLQSSHQKPRLWIKKPLLCIDYDAVNVENDASNLLTAVDSTSQMFVNNNNHYNKGSTKAINSMYITIKAMVVLDSGVSQARVYTALVTSDT